MHPSPSGRRGQRPGVRETGNLHPLSADKALDIKACHVGYAYRKGDTKMRDYVDGFIKKIRESGKLQSIIKEYMTPAQINAAG
jgi:ABC-type amino acid transport substrate-binding protein